MSDYVIRYKIWNKDWLTCAKEFAQVYDVNLSYTWEAGFVNRTLYLSVHGPEAAKEKFHIMFGHLLRHHGADHTGCGPNGQTAGILDPGTGSTPVQPTLENT